jgi:hypothetical protein
MYQAGGPALRFDKDALAELERGSEGPSPTGRPAAPPGSAPADFGGLSMNASVMFLDCPAYMDKTGAVRCGLPAEVEGRYLMRSTDGPLESARIRCPRGHWFNGPIESLTLEEIPAPPPPAQPAEGSSARPHGRLAPNPPQQSEREAIARIKDAPIRRPGPGG